MLWGILILQQRNWAGCFDWENVHDDNYSSGDGDEVENNDDHDDSDDDNFDNADDDNDDRDDDDDDDPSCFA